MKLHSLKYEDIAIGDSFSFKKKVSRELVNTFARISGDQNPIHIDDTYARNTEFGKNIAHGMLLASLFSALVGMFCPGERSLYISQTCNFRNPCFVGKQVVVSGVVTAKVDAFQIIELSTVVKDEKGAILVNGVARVKVRKIN